MSGSETQAVLKLVPRIDAVDAAAWDACAGGDPFLSHAFLHALEASGSAEPGTGWAPQHLVLEDMQGGIAGCVPMYLKSHSYGEYVFDHGWAAALQRAGGRYYPKLQVCVPFTPVPGYRLLTRPGVDRVGTVPTLLAGCMEVARQRDVSSLHITFCSEPEWRELAAHGLLQRTGEQFHWKNQGYGSFDDFLGELASRKRKALRKERQSVRDAGIRIEAVSGGDLTERHWDAMYRFYIDTGNRKWGTPYLTRDFFTRLGATMADRVVLFLASRDGHHIAAALNLMGPEALYGRYWGCTEHHPYLHFELCYYQAIDWAIARRLGRVEAGAQGEHKLARGYLPTPTYSLHWIADPGFRRAVANYLVQERRQVAADIELLSEHSPFRQEPER